MNPRLTFVWTLLFAALVAHQVYLWRGGLQVETDLLALLPHDERDEAAEGALRNLSATASKQVVVLVQGDDAPQAARRFAEAIDPEVLRPLPLPDGVGTTLLDALMPYRDRLLTAAQVQRLSSETGAQLTERAVLQLQQPMSQRLGEFTDDPLQLFPEFLRERAAASRVRPVDGQLRVGDAVLLRYEVQGGGFALSSDPRLRETLDAARAKAGDARITAAGVPLFAEAASVQASGEVNTVGWGSLAAILLVMFLAFRSPRPLLLVVLSVGTGVACGLSLTALVFGKVHLMTLVFGASLVGVAEDYGIHYFASRQARPDVERHLLLEELKPGLFLALITSVAGYVMLFITPMPGLRQVALFSAAGLTGAYLTVIAFFPFLDAGKVKPTRFSRVWAGTRAKWPHLSGARLVMALLAVGAVAAAGLVKLTPSDDVRGLQANPPELLAAQREVAETIGLPSPAQFFIVRGDSEGQRLEREEALREKLDGLVSRGLLARYDALSQWVPSPKRQGELVALSAKARAAVLDGLKDELDVVPPYIASKELKLETLLATPLNAALKPLLVEGAHLVMLHAPSREGLSEFSALDVPGVKFIDRTADISALMQRWRVGMTELLAAGYVVIFIALFIRFRARAWRALLPTVVASALALALVGYLGEPLSLFHVLALWLLLGMGVDYGIFLSEHPDDGGEAWLAVGLGAVSTLLSFGLLAVSKTQAIHAFGVTLGAGIALVWLLSPMVAPRVVEKPH